MIELLESVGFVINNEKSIVISVQRITYFGFILDSMKFMVFLPYEKVQKIKPFASRLLAKSKVPIRELASFNGLLLNAFLLLWKPKCITGTWRGKRYKFLMQIQITIQ